MYKCEHGSTNAPDAYSSNLSDANPVQVNTLYNSDRMSRRH